MRTLTIYARTGAILFLWCVITGFSPASNVPSQADKSPEIASRDTTATFNSKVSLVMVPVVVRDGKGYAIGTLRKEDFQLFDKGKPQTISKFTIEKADGSVVPLEVTSTAEPSFEKEAEKAPTGQAPTGQAPKGPPPASRFTAYMFDDMHANAADLMAAREAAIKYLNESLRPADRAAVYTTSARTTLEFTDDKEKLKETINRIAPRLVRVAKRCPDISEYLADELENKNAGGHFDRKDQQNPLTVAVVEVLKCEPRITVDEATIIARNAATEVYFAADADAQTSLAVLSDVVKRMSAMPGQRTIVLASPGFMVMSHQQMETEIADQAIRSNVTISSLDARGVYARTPYTDASERSLKLANFNEAYQNKAAMAQSDVLEELADATGGTFFHNNNDLQEGFRRTGAVPEFIYVLGFAPQNLKYDGRFHELKVTAKDIKGVTLKARHGYYVPKQADDPVAAAKEEIRVAVFSRDEIADIPVELHTQFFKATDQNAKLAVLAHIDLKHLHFKKVDGRNQNTLSIVSAVFDRNGILVGATQKELDLRLKDDTFEARIANGIVLKTSFDVPPGSYVVRVVVRDSEGQSMAARNGVVEIP